MRKRCAALSMLSQEGEGGCRQSAECRLIAASVEPRPALLIRRVSFGLSLREQGPS